MTFPPRLALERCAAPPATEPCEEVVWGTISRMAQHLRHREMEEKAHPTRCSQKNTGEKNTKIICTLLFCQSPRYAGAPEWAMTMPECFLFLCIEKQMEVGT